MDWGLFFGAGSFFIALTLAISTFVYFIMKLQMNPMKEDVDELKKAIAELTKNINELTRKVKTETDLIRIIDERIVRHEKACLNYKQIVKKA